MIIYTNKKREKNQVVLIVKVTGVLRSWRCVTGGLGSPRQYAGRGDHAPNHPPQNMHHQYPQHPVPPHPHSQPIPQHQHPQMMYQDSQQYCYDQTGLQLAFNGPDRGRGPPPPHLQGGK